MAKGYTVKFEGLDELTAKFEQSRLDIHPRVRAIVKNHGKALQQRTKDNMSAKYTGHYEGHRFVRPTGKTSGSVKVFIEDGGMTAVVSPGTYYFPYLEFGTRFMSARPTLRPAFTYQSMQFINDMKKLVH